MLRKEGLDRRCSMVGCPVLQHDDRAGGLGKHRVQERLVGVGGEARGLVLPEEAAGKVVNEAEHLERFTLGTGGHPRLPAAPRPGKGKRAPLGEADLVTKKQESTAALSRRQ